MNTPIFPKIHFCYWLEHETNELGGIRGGNSNKFGIYKMVVHQELNQQATEPMMKNKHGMLNMGKHEKRRLIQ